MEVDRGEGGGIKKVSRNCKVIYFLQFRNTNVGKLYNRADLMTPLRHKRQHGPPETGPGSESEGEVDADVDIHVGVEGHTLLGEFAGGNVGSQEEVEARGAVVENPAE